MSVSEHEFVVILHSILEETFPDTERFIVAGGDYFSDVVMELSQADKKLRYSPYELYKQSDDYEDTIEEFINKWKSILESE